VQLAVPPDKIVSRLKRGAVLQPDGSQKVHTALSRLLKPGGELLLASTKRCRGKASGCPPLPEWRAGSMAARGSGLRIANRWVVARDRAACASTASTCRIPPTAGRDDRGTAVVQQTGQGPGVTSRMPARPVSERSTMPCSGRSENTARSRCGASRASDRAHTRSTAAMRGGSGGVRGVRQ
jgi:hypothetical protein